MAPTKSVKGKSSKGGKSGGGKSGGVAKKSSKPRPTGNAPEGISKRKQKSMVLAKPGGAQKTKSRLDTSGKRKRRLYSEKELDIPKLNGIVPAGIAKPKGQKKGKVFVDDPVSMMAIMSVVNAEKDKDVESKIMRSRQLEEVREAKRKEAEAKAEEKKAKFEETKKSLKKKHKGRHSDPARIADIEDEDEQPKSSKSKRKRVSFG